MEQHPHVHVDGGSENIDLTQIDFAPRCDRPITRVIPRGHTSPAGKGLDGGGKGLDDTICCKTTDCSGTRKDDGFQFGEGICTDCVEQMLFVGENINLYAVHKKVLFSRTKPFLTSL
jgi:hypothetical protein